MEKNIMTKYVFKMFKEEKYVGSLNFTNLKLMFRTAKNLLKKGYQINISEYGTIAGVFVLQPKDYFLSVDILIKRLHERIFK